MVKHTQTIRPQEPTNCLNVFDYFVGLALKGLTEINKNTKVGRKKTKNTEKKRNIIKQEMQKQLLYYIHPQINLQSKVQTRMIQTLLNYHFKYNVILIHHQQLLSLLLLVIELKYINMFWVLRKY